MTRPSYETREALLLSGQVTDREVQEWMQADPDFAAWLKGRAASRQDGTKDDGGPAFPCEIPGRVDRDTQTPTQRFTGLTVRDYFAGHALAGILAGPCSKDGVPMSEWLDIPDHAYRLADLMLTKRKTEAP